MARILPKLMFPTLLVVVSAGAVQACPSFGLSSPYLSDFFCNQLDDIAGPKTRTILDGDAPRAEDGLTQPHPDWLELPVIQDAWRSDPAKTLKLIERIRDAGGRPLK